MFSCIFARFHLCFFQGTSSPLLRVVWARLILDEAHNVKNPRVQTSMAVCKLQAQARWAVTGTPIQNNLLDMYSLLKWVNSLRLGSCEPFQYPSWLFHISYHRCVHQISVCSRWQTCQRVKDKGINIYENIICWLTGWCRAFMTCSPSMWKNTGPVKLKETEVTFFRPSNVLSYFCFKTYGLRSGLQFIWSKQKRMLIFKYLLLFKSAHTRI